MTFNFDLTVYDISKDKADDLLVKLTLLIEQEAPDSLIIGTVKEEQDEPQDATQ